MRPAVQEMARQSAGPCPTIETQRLVLRPHRLGDADAIAQSLGDFEVVRMLTRVHLPYDRQDALDWLAQATSRRSQDWHLAITMDGETHLGVVSLEHRHGQWHLGYWLNHGTWGKGVMSEAVGATIDRFRQSLPETTIHSGVFADNPASLRIQEKHGFQIMRTSTIFSRARNAMAPHIETALPSGTRINEN